MQMPITVDNFQAVLFYGHSLFQRRQVAASFQQSAFQSGQNASKAKNSRPLAFFGTVLVKRAEVP
jgi:hypothetical protein